MWYTYCHICSTYGADGDRLVETSNNLASIKPVPEDKTYSIVLTTRSSITPALQVPPPPLSPQTLPQATTCQ